jgi:hypothetical protein
VIDRIATLDEIDRHWTLTDIYKANALLDMKADIKAQAIEAANKK